MKKLFYLPLCLILFFACNDVQKEITTNVSEISRNGRIEKYLDSDSKNMLSIINESTVYGVIGSRSIEEMQNRGLKRCAELSGTDANLLLNKSRLYKLKSVATDSTEAELVNEILNPNVKEAISKLFYVFEDLNGFYELTDNGDEIFLFDKFSIYATNHILSCENEVLENLEMSDIDKTVFFSMSYMLNDVLGSYESLSLFISSNFSTSLKSASSITGKLWKTIKKVASVIVATVVSTVVNSVGSAIMGGNSDGIIDNILCSIPGLFYGFYEGVVLGIECDAFDLDCLLMNEDYDFACNGQSV